MEAGREKIKWIKTLRGICILAVIFIHTRNADLFRYADAGQYKWWIYVILRNLLDFPVAVFFFLSGYLVNKDKVMENPQKYIKKRFVRLGIPFLIWTVFYTAVYVYMEWPYIDIWVVISKICRGNIAVPLYFILVLLQMTLLTPVILKWKQKAVLWLVSPLCMLGNFVYIYVNKREIPSSQLFFGFWLIYYLLGISLQGRSLSKPLFTKGKLQVFIAAAIVTACLDSVLLSKWNLPSNYVYSQIRLGMISYILLLAIWCHKYMQSSKVVCNKLFSILGDCSEGIYYIHVFFLYCINKILIILGGGVKIIFLVEFVEVIFAAFLSVLSCKIARKILGEKRAAKYLGM